MISCLWAILCEKSLINEETGNITLIEVIEEITLPPPPESDEIPFIFFNFSLVICWEKQELSQPQDEDKFRLRIVSPSKEPLLEAERTIDFTEDLRTFTVLNFPTFPVPESGLYEFQIQFPRENETQWDDVQIVQLKVNYYEQLEQVLEN